MLRFPLPAITGPRTRGGLGLGVCALTALAATACSSASPGHRAAVSGGNPAAAASPSPSPRGSASAGPIRITGAYLPQPASPDVAAVYFTVADDSDQADVLVSAACVPSAQVSLMQESSSGGADSMTMLPSGLPIPAHGQVALAPDGYHVMLTDPAVPLEQGGTVLLTLHFAHAGNVLLEVPVTSLFSDALTAPTTTEGSMAAMPGM